MDRLRVKSRGKPAKRRGERKLEPKKRASPSSAWLPWAPCRAMGVFAPTEPCGCARPLRGREVTGALCARPSGAGGAGPSDAGLPGGGTTLWAEGRGEVQDGGRAEEGASVGEDAGGGGMGARPPEVEDASGCVRPCGCNVSDRIRYRERKKMKRGKKRNKSIMEISP